MNGTIAERLSGFGRAYLDTMTVIYFIEEHPKYRGAVRPVFELLDSQRLTGLSSYLTLLEVLVQPVRQGRPDLAQQYRETLLEAPGFTLFPVDRRIAEQGAAIRAQYGFRTPDAIQLATAAEHGAQVFITNDAQLRRFQEVQVLVLDKFVTDHQETKE